ncbi:MAG: CRISPR system precrRNA processing endoribonuclease RAMP protein Cas6 [Acidobacteriia bacterium]|nr:CRISPR system precrRNA processing endoribonuclease RAMP protein Cas6 [Terriglobia bacterium]
MDFRLYPLRFSFIARDSVRFPPGKAANVLRGALGLALLRLGEACPTAYARLFEPKALDPGPSGLADRPRPYVFRATHLDGRTIPPGQPFHFDFHLFEIHNPPLDLLRQSFAEAAAEGLGPGRGRAECRSCGPPALLTLPLDPPPHPVTRVAIRFVTPTELKGGSQLAGHPEFAILAARIRDRIGALRALYGDGPLPIDFRGFGERAARVRMTRCQLRHIELSRRSSRTGQVHPLGGFVGEAEYEGELTEFLPYLQAAQWTGVGRQTVWGKGEIEVL